MLKKLLKLIILARQTSAVKQVLKYLKNNQLNHVGSSSDNSSFSYTHFSGGLPQETLWQHQQTQTC